MLQNHARLTWLLLVLTLSSLLTGCDRRAPYQQQFLQFGTVIEITLISHDQQAAHARFNEINNLLDQRHRDWHGWRDGALKQFNQALTTPPSAKIPVPEVLRSLIDDSKKYHELSGGLFNPAMGKLIAAWGFHANEQPDHELIERIKQDMPTMQDLILDDGQASTSNPHLQLDFGAIAKGLGVRQIADLLSRNNINDYIINAGGDVFASGQKINRAWRVAIENPFQPGIIASLDLPSSQAIFTSGNYRRFHLDADNTRRHHIIDPTTGEPSLRISAASVIHSDPVIADIAATTLMLTPIEKLPGMARKLGLQHLLVITEEREVYLTASMRERITWQTGQSFTQYIIEP